MIWWIKEPRSMKKYIATWLQLTLYLYFAVIFNRSFLFLQLSSPLITYLKLSGSSFSICAYHFSFAVNLKSNGRDEFFLFHFIMVYLYNSKLNLLAGGRIHVFLKKVFQTVKGRNQIQWYHFWLRAKKIHLFLTKTAWQKPITFSLWKHY